MILLVMLLKIHYERLKVWKELIFRPNETVKKETKNASFARGAKDIAVVSFIFSMIMIIIYALMFGFFFLLALLPILGIASGQILSVLLFFVAILIGSVICSILFSIIGWLFYAGFEFVLAKILGGVGTYKIHAYLAALQSAGLMLVTIPFSIISLIPCMGMLIYPVTMLIAIYGVYIRYLIVKQVHHLSRNRAILVVISPVILLVGFLVALYIGLFFLGLLARVRH